MHTYIRKKMAANTNTNIMLTFLFIFLSYKGSTFIHGSFSSFFLAFKNVISICILNVGLKIKDKKKTNYRH